MQFTQQSKMQIADINAPLVQPGCLDDSNEPLIFISHPGFQRIYKSSSYPIDKHAATEKNIAKWSRVNGYEFGLLDLKYRGLLEYARETDTTVIISVACCNFNLREGRSVINPVPSINLPYAQFLNQLLKSAAAKVFILPTDSCTGYLYGLSYISDQFQKWKMETTRYLQQATAGRKMLLAGGAIGICMRQSCESYFDQAEFVLLKEYAYVNTPQVANQTGLRHGDWHSALQYPSHVRADLMAEEISRFKRSRQIQGAAGLIVSSSGR